MAKLRMEGCSHHPTQVALRAAHILPPKRWILSPMIRSSYLISKTAQIITIKIATLKSMQMEMVIDIITVLTSDFWPNFLNHLLCTEITIQSKNQLSQIFSGITARFACDFSTQFWSRAAAIITFVAFASGIWLKRRNRNLMKILPKSNVHIVKRLSLHWRMCLMINRL